MRTTILPFLEKKNSLRQMTEGVFLFYPPHFMWGPPGSPIKCGMTLK